MSNANASDPVALIVGPTLSPEPYGCGHCHAIATYPASLPTGGIACKLCSANVTTTDIVSFASFGKRLLALVCDFALLVPPFVMLIVLPVYVAIGFSPKDRYGRLTEAAVLWITVAVIASMATLVLGYFSFGNVNGQTVGRRFTGLKVVRFDTGDRLGVGRGLVRTLAQLATIGTLGIGYAMALVDERRRTLHDRIAGSVVVEL